MCCTDVQCINASFIYQGVFTEYVETTTWTFQNTKKNSVALLGSYIATKVDVRVTWSIVVSVWWTLYSNRHSRGLQFRLQKKTLQISGNNKALHKSTSITSFTWIQIHPHLQKLQKRKLNPRVPRQGPAVRKLQVHLLSFFLWAGVQSTGNSWECFYKATWGLVCTLLFTLSSVSAPTSSSSSSVSWEREFARSKPKTAKHNINQYNFIPEQFPKKLTNKQASLLADWTRYRILSYKVEIIRTWLVDSSEWTETWTHGSLGREGSGMPSEWTNHSARTIKPPYIATHFRFRGTFYPFEGDMTGGGGDSKICVERAESWKIK